MGPLIPQQIIDPAWNNLIGFLVGMCFGLILEASGFSSSRKITGVFYGYDFTVMKVFMTAVAVAMVGLLYFNYFGWIDLSLVYVNPLFLNATIVGGFIMGIGFLMGGFCPGTSFAGAAIGKIDAIVFSLGMFLGILLFSEAFPLVETLYNAGDYGGLTITEVLGISPGLFAFFFVCAMLMLFGILYYFRDKFRKIEI
ncbi:MAG TPA: YeeE/YedE thiosulfate transporter family protein [Bacteroidales bacterium]|nr:YeeE/YedE thiosulfate transporter family protein [Bacteroidales bacterium]HSA42076.1 YeeE/YedE thiosulfate transporter family protein [Bacteroidales bacterium]